MCCKLRAELVAAQEEKVAALEAELVVLVAEGNDYHAGFVRSDLAVAKCLARLIHSHPTTKDQSS